MLNGSDGGAWLCSGHLDVIRISVNHPPLVTPEAASLSTIADTAATRNSYDSGSTSDCQDEEGDTVDNIIIR